MVKIKIKDLGMTKAVEVKNSIKNKKKMGIVQLALLKEQDDTTDINTPLEEVQQGMNLIQEIEDFLIDVLKLDKKQVEKMEDLEEEQLGMIVGEVIIRIQGASEKDIEDYYKERDEESPLAEEKD
ncbi:phage tail tube assembly chaperone [Pediococcus argentinicus]|uniref:phage tail tube assembly chaperone n=1 Tax=Pediococcus argentinicus TaxID=480391 RepID=UPI00338E762D